MIDSSNVYRHHTQRNSNRLHCCDAIKVLAAEVYEAGISINGWILPSAIPKLCNVPVNMLSNPRFAG